MDVGQEGCRERRMQGKKDAWKEGVKTGGIQEKRDQDRRDTEWERCYSRQEG